VRWLQALRIHISDDVAQLLHVADDGIPHDRQRDVGQLGVIAAGHHIAKSPQAVERPVDPVEPDPDSSKLRSMRSS
jgi:hypothetical protein